METKYLNEEDIWFVKIDNDLDLYTVPELRKVVTECIKEKETDFILECSQMGFIDSTGLGELASLMKTVKKIRWHNHDKRIKRAYQKSIFDYGA